MGTHGFGKYLVAVGDSVLAGRPPEADMLVTLDYSEKSSSESDHDTATPHGL